MLYIIAYDIPDDRRRTDPRFALEQLFYRLAMSAIDICFHLVAKRKAKVPDTYKNCFQHLLEEGLIDVETKQKLTELAGLRNLIAHVYWELDYERLYDYLDELESLERRTQGTAKQIR